MNNKILKPLVFIGTLNENPLILDKYLQIVDIPARLLVLLGIGPSLINFIGLICGVVGGIFIAYGLFFPAFALILIAGLADALDGAVARRMGVESDLGSFLDSVFDRYVDISILLGILWYFALSDERLPALLASLALLGTVVTSYAKAKGESLGIPRRSVGIMNRLERICIYLIGLLFPGSLPILLWPLSVMANLTGIHRIFFYARSLSATNSLKSHHLF